MGRFGKSSYREYCGGSFSCESQFAILAKRIQEVLDIDTSQPYGIFEQKLKKISVPVREPARGYYI